MTKSTLKWISFVAVAVTILSLLPQMRFWLFRGGQWHGAYATIDGDEFLYSAYVNALIDGRPRKNDPFSGRNDNPKAPLPESTFSIQVVPAFAITSVARMFGCTASTAFIGLIAMAGLLTSLSIFFLLVLVTADARLSAVGTLIVICFGSAAAGQGLLGLLVTGDASVGLLFLRRYQPAATLFLFFVFCGLIWCGLNVNRTSRARLYAAFAGICLGLLVFSYLYLWTAAVAWLILLGILWAWLSRKSLSQLINVLGIVTLVFGIVFPVYAYLLSHRAANLTEVQTLVSTHKPDLVRMPEVLGIFVLFGFVWMLRSGRLASDDRSVIFGVSFATLPLVLFNQQLITGKAIQAFHFQDFIANYVVLLSVVVLLRFWVRRMHPRLWVWLSILCLLWGVIEVDLPAKARYTSDLTNDEMIPTLLRLKEFATEDGTWSSLQNEGNAPTVFSPHSEVMRLLPTWTPYGTLLGLGGLDFGSASRNDKRVYTYLYYSGVTKEGFEQLLDGTSEDGFMNYYTRSAVFGHERVLSKLTYHFEPIQHYEIDEQLRFYDAFVGSFSKDNAYKYRISYLIVLAETNFDFSRIDRWYERDVGERIGIYYLYRLKPRN
jgi:hypothetical protein